MSLRPFPESVKKPGTTRAFIAYMRKAFDADPGATFCAAELDGITLVLARGARGDELQKYVQNRWYGVIQRAPVPDAEGVVAGDGQP